MVGFIFANALSLMAAPSRWWGVFKGANISGAATGLAINWGDPTLLPRWLFMFCLAILTTAVYVKLDAAYLTGPKEDDYRRYASRFAFAMYSVGLAMFVAIGSWYIFGTRPSAFPQAMHSPLMRIIFPLTMISPGAPWLLMLVGMRLRARSLAALAGLAQFGVIVLNAISRQWLQNVELAPYSNLASRPVDLQLSALIVFLALFVFGIGLIAWMLVKAVQANRSAFPSNL